MRTESPTSPGGGSDWGTGNRDAGAKRERALRRLEDAVARQAIQRRPWCSITVEGSVESVEYKNPHSIIVVRQDDGTAYTVDWGIG